ncbi:Protein kinase domain [Carpediemonas membranifera]|uniref:Protein kinase domain n=1 Tax=Carpediemonas membranifera TaxID=201153 RepID=A0A8J6B0X0_9EUKA|nr:Protein kinase domain [Carpediemonas membranifera]|eukprot:KAG9391894.1 Protein kinase domain [Carpediemonas membranifera]
MSSLSSIQVLSTVIQPSWLLWSTVPPSLASARLTPACSSAMFRICCRQYATCMTTGLSIAILSQTTSSSARVRRDTSLIFGSAMRKPANGDDRWAIQLRFASEYRGTHGYLPPELFYEYLVSRSVIPAARDTSKLARMTAGALSVTSYVVTPASDIYSCGIVIMMLVNGLSKSPFAAKVTDMGANMAQIDNKKKKKMLKLGSLLNWCQFYGGQLQLSPQAQTHFKDCLECVNVNSELPIRGTTPPTCLSLYDLAMQMLHFDPAKRPTAAECLDKLKVIMRVHECVAKPSPLLLDDTEEVTLSAAQRKRLTDCCQRGFEGQVFYRRCIVCGRDLHGRENVSCDTCHKGYRQVSTNKCAKGVRGRLHRQFIAMIERTKRD